MKSLDSETFSLPVVGEREDDEEETVEVTLYDMQRGRDVKAVHRRGGERLNSYTFRVVDEAWRVCAHRSEDEPPIGVVQAVERFGYHVSDAGSYPLEYADVQHVGHVFDVLESIHSTSSDPLLCGFLSHATLPVGFELAVLDLRAAIVDNHGKDAFDEVLDEALQRFVDEHGKDGVAIEADEFHRELAEVATDGGRLCSEDLSDESSMTVDDLITVHQVNRRWDGQSVVTLESTEVNGNRKLLTTYFDSHHVDRYEFDVLDRDEKTCVFQRGDARGRPPAEVIEEVRQAGYEIANIPVLHPDDTTWEQLAAADRLLDDITQSYEAGELPPEPLHRGRTAVQNALTVAVIREAMEPEQYVRTLAQAVHASALVESTGELESVSRISDLEDFLWEHFPKFIDSETKREIGEFYEERDIF